MTTKNRLNLRKIYEGKELLCEIGIKKIDLPETLYGVCLEIEIRVDDLHLFIERLQTPKHIRDIISIYLSEDFMLNEQKGWIFE